VKWYLLAVLLPFAVSTIVGLVVLWPAERPAIDPAIELPQAVVEGQVRKVVPVPCAPGAPVEVESGEPCKLLDVRLTSGRRRGETFEVWYPDDRPTRRVEVGDRLVLGVDPGKAPPYLLHVVDYQRRFPLLQLGVVFAVVVAWLGRWRGLRALGGFVLSLVVLVVFVLPAILAGRSPLAVAVVGSAAIMFLALYFSHGVNVRTSSALIGTMVSLALTAMLANLYIEAAALSGFTSEQAVVVNLAASQVDVRGLLLAGILIGALGVLDDVTITQASAVWELHIANPAYGARDLYRSALAIGRDHIASTVNTLVLAYAGAALPLLILFTLARLSVGEVLNGEVIAEEVVRTLVGSIGLVASVPITTGLTALVVSTDRPTS
jgi:uncharacterized membrane protein